GRREVDGRAVAARRLDLERAHALPHLDEAVDALLRRGPRDGLRMVPGRPRHDAVLPLLSRQSREPVERAPRLERARLLEQLRLERDAERARPESRRAVDPPGEDGSRALDVLPQDRHAGSVSRAATCGTPRRTVKTVSVPGRLSPSTSPPMASVSSLTIARPRPVPTFRS